MVKKNSENKSRKNFLILLLVFIFLSLFILTVFVYSDNSENYNSWNMHGKYLNHTSWDGIDFSTIPGLNEVNFSMGVASSGSNPAIAYGYVYVGSNAKFLYQLNASNISQQVRNFSGDSATIIQSSPAIANGYVYYSASVNKVYQLNATSLSHVYNYTVDDGFSGSSPVVSQNYLYIGNVGGEFYQLNATNISHKINLFTVTPTPNSFIFQKASITDLYVYIASYSTGYVYQLNATNISLQVSNFSVGRVYGSSIAVYNDFLYVGSNERNTTYQLNATNVSQQLNNFTLGGRTVSSPMISDGYVYIGCYDNKLYQLNATNISINYANFTANDTFALASPTSAYGHVYIGDSSGIIYQLNATNITKQIANYSTGSGISSTISVAKGYIYVVSGSGIIYQLNATNISMSNVDAFAPLITIDHPTLNYANNDSVPLNFTATDPSSVSSCWYKVVNKTGGELVIDNTTITNCLNTTFKIVGGDYDYNLTLYSNDSLNNLGSETVTFGIRTNAPAVILNYPPDNKWFNYKNNIYFNFTATDSDGLDTCELWGNWTGTFHKNYSWYAPNSGIMNYTRVNLTDGSYIYIVGGNDTVNNFGWAISNYTFHIDTIYPNVSINSITPTVGLQTFKFNHTTQDKNVETCFYSIFNLAGGIDGTNRNVSFTCGTGLNAFATVTAYGTYNLTIYANDSAGNENSSTKQFTVSSTITGGETGGGGGLIIETILEPIPTMTPEIVCNRFDEALSESWNAFLSEDKTFSGFVKMLKELYQAIICRSSSSIVNFVSPIDEV